MSFVPEDRKYLQKFLKIYLFEVEAICIFIEEFLVAYLFGDHAATTLRAEYIHFLSGKE